MKIEPIKNYKKPKYAAALAAVTAVGTMSGCIPMGTPGIGPTPVDTTTTQYNPPPDPETVDYEKYNYPIFTKSEKAEIDKFWEMYYEEKKSSELYIEAFKKYGLDLIRTEEDVSGDFAVGAYYDENHKLVIAFSRGNVEDKNLKHYTKTKYGNFAVVSSYWVGDNNVFDTYMVAYIDMTKSPLENLDEIAAAIVNDANNTMGILYDGGVPVITEEELEIEGGIIVEPDEEELIALEGDVAIIPDEEETFELAGDVAVISEEELELEGKIAAPSDVTAEYACAEEFSLAGDIVIPPDYISDRKGMEHAEKYMAAFKERGITLSECTSEEGCPDALGFGEIPFIPALKAEEYRFFISFYSSDDTALCSEIEKAGGEGFSYGYINKAYFNNSAFTILFIDVNSPHSENTSEIADYAISMGLEKI